MTASWKPLYDLRLNDPSYPLVFVVIGCVLALIAVVWFLRSRGFMPLMLGGAALIMLVFGVIYPAWERGQVLARLAQGRVQRVEGPVTDYRALASERYRRSISEMAHYDRWERFSVGGEEFTFAAGRFDRSMQQRGETPIAFRDGLQLRIAWVDLEFASLRERVIATIDWAEPTATTPTPPTSSTAADEETRAMIEALRREAEAANAAAAEAIRTDPR
jgi:hypothetical protein